MIHLSQILPEISKLWFLLNRGHSTTFWAEFCNLSYWKMQENVEIITNHIGQFWTILDKNTQKRILWIWQNDRRQKPDISHLRYFQTAWVDQYPVMKINIANSNFCKIFVSGFSIFSFSWFIFNSMIFQGTVLNIYSIHSFVWF